MIVDAGPLYATIDRDDPSHAACREALEASRGPLVVPTMGLAEVAHLVESRLGTAAALELLRALADGTRRRLGGVVDGEPPR